VGFVLIIQVAGSLGWAWLAADFKENLKEQITIAVKT